MADRYIALLRGINLGKAKRIAMADLRTLFEKLGFADVRTLLNSGNVVFGLAGKAGKGLSEKIETAIEAKLGVYSRVTVLSSAELDTIVAGNPLLSHADDHSRLMVSVLNHDKNVALLKPLSQRDWKPDRLAIGTRVAYLWCPKGILESDLANAMAKLLGDGVTTRNWATILKLHGLVQSPP